MRLRFLILIIALFAAVGIGYQEIAAQTAVTCPDLVQKALQTVATNCNGLDRDNACYGYNSVSATFNNPQPSGYFSQPSDRASVPDLQTLTTSPLQQTLNKWGIALMSLQANLPDTLPGQNVVFMLLGDSQIENAVSPDQTFQGGKTLSVTLQISGNLYFQPDMSSKVVGSVPQDTSLTADAISSDGQWVRVDYGGIPGWLTKQVISASGDLTTLPVVGPDTKTPMQAFYLRTSVTGTSCNEAPNALLVQGPKNLMIDIEANGANIRLGSTIVLYMIPIDPAEQQALTQQYGNIGTVTELMVIVVLDGHVTLNPGQPNQVTLTTGETSSICLSNPENLGDDGQPNDRQVFGQCPWSPPRPVTDTDIEQFRYLQGVTLNYPIDLPLELPPPTATPTFTPRPTRPVEQNFVNPTSTLAPTLAPAQPTATPWPTSAPTHKPTSAPPPTPTQTPSLSPSCPINVTAPDSATLIAAINDANSQCPTSANTITLSSGGTYEFANIDNSTDGGNLLPVIASNITINGNGSSFTPDGVLAARFFEVASGATLTLNGVTLQNGKPSSANGGDIDNKGTLTLFQTSVRNGTGTSGGGLYNSGTATVKYSTISNNTASNSGGGIDNDGTLNLLNSTIADNTGVGSQLMNDGTAVLNFTTLFSNTGGNANLDFDDGSMTVKNSVIAYTGEGSACSGGAPSGQGVNFASDATCGSGFIGSDAINVQDLADNGGPTQTDALGVSSVAIDTATDCTTTGGQTVSDDQRGVTRPVGSTCDVGAFESPMG